MAVRPQSFAEQLAVLQRHAQIVTLNDLVKGLKEGQLPSGSAAITFDDGYTDILFEVKPLLEHYEIPVTLFVATGYLGRRFWWDQLATMVLASDKLPEQLSINQDGRTTVWSLVDFGGKRKALLQRIYQSLLVLEAEERKRAITQLSQQISMDFEQVARDDRALTAEELTKLASDGLVTVGAHTINHPILTNLSEDSRRREIEQSKRFLETLLNKPVTTFSYPNGASDEKTRQLVRAANYTCACSSFNDVTRPGTDPFNLPRFWVPDRAGGDFSRWLRRWLVN